MQQITAANQTGALLELSDCSNTCLEFEKHKFLGTGNHRKAEQIYIFISEAAIVSNNKTLHFPRFKTEQSLIGSLRISVPGLQAPGSWRHARLFLCLCQGLFKYHRCRYFYYWTSDAVFAFLSVFLLMELLFFVRLTFSDNNIIMIFDFSTLYIMSKIIIIWYIRYTLFHFPL